ncbi:MAG: HNH endonuclease [Oscillospiraceae bacterium]|nr:HNH endonuclease [Oscillospiraceae bacterium]
MKGEVYSREETMLVFELYCTIPNGQDTIYNPSIIAMANALGRPVNSVKLKLQNFKSYDPAYTQDGKIGLSHGSKLDEEICREFFQNWDSLVAETNDIKKSIGLAATEEIQAIPAGGNKPVTAQQRIGQTFFRKALLSAYDNKCCFTGIAIPELLRASHIKPWAKSNDVNEKANPRNGLLLNALHDAAFDNGYITITFDYRILVSQKLLSASEVDNAYFAPLNGKKMILPSRFLPDRQFIEYHNNIFKE